MRNVGAWFFGLGAGLLLAVFCSAATSSLAPALQAYLEGLDELAAARPAAALEPLDRAAAAAPRDPRIALARGVALTLAERFEPAMLELARAKQLRLPGREADLWTYTVVRMGGNATPENNFNAGPSFGGTNYISMPSNLVQGRDDYPTDFASLVYYEMAGAVGRAHEEQRPVDRPALRETIARASRWFANRAKSQPDLVGALMERAIAQNQRGDFATALDNLLLVRAVEPDSAAVAYQLGNTWLGLGRPITAWREYNQALIADPNFNEGYLGRALASSRWGDTARTERDYDRAKDRGIAAKSYRQEIDRNLAKWKVNEAPAALLAALEKSARGNAPDSTLLDQAAGLQRAMAAQRLRYDDWYQNRLADLDEVVRAKPKNTHAKVELAQFLAEEAASGRRGESVEPRRPLVSYRPRPSDPRELQHALRVLDTALASDMRMVSALIAKAGVLSRLGDDNQAEKLVDQTLTLAPRDPEALRLRATYWVDRANNLSLQASALRSPRSDSSTHTESRSDGVYEVTTTTYYQPTQADLGQAATFENAAADLRRRAAGAINDALKVTRGTLDGLLLQAEVDLNRGDPTAALTSLQSAVKTNPTSVRAREALVAFFRRTRDVDRTDLEQSLATNLIHTTAAWKLRPAWRHIEAQQFEPAEKDLLEARTLDPADARTPTYLGVIREAQGRTDEAVVNYRVALALEEARVQLDETPAGKGSALPRDALDFGLALRLRERLATLRERAGDIRGALALYGGNTARAKRVSPPGRATEMFTAMLPRPGAPTMPPPTPVNAATLLAEAHTNAGRMLQKLNRNDEAQTQFLAAASYGPKEHVTRIGSLRNGRLETNFAGDAQGNTAEAYIALAKDAVKRRDPNAALKYINLVSALRVPPEQRPEVERAVNEILDSLNRLQ